MDPSQFPPLRQTWSGRCHWAAGRPERIQKRTTIPRIVITLPCASICELSLSDVSAGEKANAFGLPAYWMISSSLRTELRNELIAAGRQFEDRLPFLRPGRLSLPRRGTPDVHLRSRLIGAALAGRYRRGARSRRNGRVELQRAVVDPPVADDRPVNRAVSRSREGQSLRPAPASGRNDGSPALSRPPECPRCLR